MKRQGKLAIYTHGSRLIAALALGGLLAGCSGSGGSDGGYGAPTSPTVSLTVAPTTIGLGQSATLTWASNQGTTCEASGGWSGTRQSSDAAEVVPTATGAVTYTLTCSGSAFSGSTARSVTLNVEPPSPYTVTSLVEDFAGGAARTTDSLLVNPWGLAFGPTTATWVTNNASDTATIYDGNGRPSPLTVHFARSSAGASFGPTGIVFDGSADFVLNRAGQTAAAVFVIAGEGGMIAGWSPGLDVANTITMYTAADGAVYKGLALASNGGGSKFLYATDFANAKIDVFDTGFVKQTATATTFAFTDPALPAGYAPFGIHAVDDRGATRLYVSYAMRAGAEPDEEAAGAGLGLVDVFDANGTLVKHLVDAGGKLDAPWGMAFAPADFGTLSNALLVGNFGDGAIHGYDRVSGRYLGAVSDGSGIPLGVPGLWSIAFGNDAVNQPHATLFFAAGINGETNGLYGRIDLGAAPPALGAYPQLTITLPPGDLSGTVAVTANAQNLVAIANVQFFVNGTAIGTATSEPFSVEWDTTAVDNGSATVRAVATDGNGNVGSSGILTVSVANAAAAATLTQIQQTVFSPRCAGCHNGSQPPGGALPGSLDLRAGSSFASLVAVASLEQPALARVAPGAPADSYVIRKLEGAPGISGARMPFGGPFLDQAAIDEVKSWIAAGAPNN